MNKKLSGIIYLRIFPYTYIEKMKLLLLVISFCLNFLFCIGQNESVPRFSINTNLQVSSQVKFFTFGGSVILRDHHSFGLGLGLVYPAFSDLSSRLAGTFDYLGYMLKIDESTVNPYITISSDFTRQRLNPFFTQSSAVDISMVGLNAGAGVSVMMWERLTARFSANYVLATYRTVVFHDFGTIGQSTRSTDFKTLGGTGSFFQIRFGLGFLF